MARSHTDKNLVFQPTGLTDSIDGTTAPSGSLALCQNLTNNPANRSQWVPRPASIKITNFSGFTSPGQVTALLVLGNLVWGMISTGRYSGHDEPFCYNLQTATFIAIGNVTSANTPLSPATTGDWTPPAMVSVTNSRIIITHPGYDGVNTFIGWIDTSSFSSTGVTGATHSSKTIDGLSSDVITINGWQVGYLIAGAGIPANTYITSINAAGTSITVSNAATATAAGVALTVSGGTAAAPLYGAGNTAPQALVAVPVAVGQFNGRAYYATANNLTLSDSQLPTQISGAGGTFFPVLTLGDANVITAVNPLPLTSQVTGGTIQSLTAFKGGSEFYQITGDPATNNLVVNAVPASVGTSAPNSVCPTPQGTAFVASDGIRILEFSGVVTEPIGCNGDGVNVPFLYAINPTRMAMAFNQNKLRVSLQNGYANGEPLQEYWYDLNLKSWSGPHTFPFALIEAYEGGVGNGFITYVPSVPGALWSSTVTPTVGSTYTENGTVLQWDFQTTLLPDNEETSMNAMIDTMVAISIPLNESLTIVVLDEAGDVIGSTSLSGPAGGSTIWDSFNWGAAVWGAGLSSFRQQALAWSQPLVFKQLSIQINGLSLIGLVIGNLYLRYEILGYELSPKYVITVPPSSNDFVLDQSVLGGSDII